MRSAGVGSAHVQESAVCFQSEKLVHGTLSGVTIIRARTAAQLKP